MTNQEKNGNALMTLLLVIAVSYVMIVATCAITGYNLESFGYMGY